MSKHTEKGPSQRAVKSLSQHLAKRRYRETGNDLSELIEKNVGQSIEKNESQFDKDVRLTKAELLEFAERVATNIRVHLKKKMTKAELAAFLTLFDKDRTHRDPSSTDGPTDPNCKCAVCEALRKRNAKPWTIYGDE